MAMELRVPTLGESVSEATVATWFKKPGDAVAQDEMLCELETDKVTVEVPAPAAGVLSEIIAAEGETVGVNALLALISEGAAAASSPAPSAAPSAVSPQSAPTAAAAQPRAPEDAPSAKRMMAETGISRDAVIATGRDGRVMKEDVQQAVARQMAQPTPTSPTPLPRGPVLADDAAREERVKMTRLRQTIARRLKEAQNTAAMLTTYN